MAARIRLKRLGRKNRAFYRVCVFDSRTRRDGTPIEELGSYDPEGTTIETKVRIDGERALYWLGVGAQPSETVASLFKRLGVRKGQPLPAGFDARQVAAEVEARAAGDAPPELAAEASTSAESAPASDEGEPAS